MENERPFVKEEPLVQRGSRRATLDERRVPSEERRRETDDEDRSPSRAHSPGRERSLPHATRESLQNRTRTPACILTEIWLRLPDTREAVFGWFREDMPGCADMFFAATGRVLEVTKAELQELRIPGPTPLQMAQVAHTALQRMARLALADPNYVINSDPPPARRPILRHEWDHIINPGYPVSLNYGFQCIECQLLRVVRRDNLQAPESLHKTYRFHCRDISLDCNEPSRARWSFSPTREVPGLGIAPVYDPINPLSRRRTVNPEIGDSLTSEPANPLIRPRSRTPPPPEDRTSVPSRSDPDPDRWRKSMKLWAGAVTYDGTPSLVQLRGWERSLKEAFETVGVPEGRSQVLQGIQYLCGEAAKWWKGIAGQPQGEALTTFDALSAALKKRFIPRSVYTKAIDDWSTLRQTGTAEEYMRRVDELSVLMPLGEAAEFAHALRGMRPEIKAEIQFRLEELGVASCGREELWRLMWLAETRYPYRPPRPFFNRNKPKPTSAKASAAETTSFVVCWICDTAGHRANTCSKRHSTGCARCGSKAHNLIGCPQRPKAKKTGTEQGQSMSGGKTKKKEKDKDRTFPK